MSLWDTTARGQKETLSLEFELDHAPEKVWRALTDPELLAQWLLPVTGFGLEPGTEFTFNRDPMPGWDGTVNCRIVECDEPRKLSYAWIVGDMDIDTVVTFTVAATESGTRLSIEQSGFKPEQKQAFGGARYGWKTMGESLVDLLARIR